MSRKPSEGHQRERGVSRPAERGSKESRPAAVEFSAEERLLLRDWCAARGCDLDEASIRRLASFRNLLIDWNARTNLTSVTDPREILIKHLLDSLAILPWVPEGAQLLDVGTGAGFPGMVLKLVRLSQPVTLAEATGRKIGFLEHVRRKFGLKSCEILHRRLQGADADLQGRFEVVVSRGVQSAGDFVRRAGPYATPRGCILAMTGREAPPEDLSSEGFQRSTGFRLERIERLELPHGSGTRHLLLFRNQGRDVPRGT